MSDIYGDEPLKYLSQTPQRQRDEIHRLQGEVEALRRERDELQDDRDARSIKEELHKGQEPVNCDLASTFGNFCQCKNHKLYLHPAPAVYQCPRCATSMEIDGW